MTNTATILSIKHEAQGVKTFEIEKPIGFDFSPGQYCWLSLPKYNPSPMALASGTNEDILKFSIRAWGELTKALFELSVGDSVIVDGPYGTSFPVERITNGQNLILIAGGTGITPVRSVVKSLQKPEIHVLYGAKSPDELLYADEINSWNANVKLTVDNPDSNWRGPIGLVTALITTENIDSSTIYFVCGPKPMEAAVVKYLLENGAKDENIYVSLEKFDSDGNVVGPVLPVSDEKVEL